MSDGITGAGNEGFLDDKTLDIASGLIDVESATLIDPEANMSVSDPATLTVKWAVIKQFT